MAVGCSAERAAALFGLIGGHLPHLVTRTIRDVCRDIISTTDATGELLAGIGTQVDAIDHMLGVGSGCGGLCGVATRAWPTPGVLDVLLKERLVVASLRKGVHVESQLVQTYVKANCSCGAY